MARILHFSDLHLDHSFADVGLPSSVGNWLRDDLRATLGRILALAREQQVDAITIAGDLFDQEYALPDTTHFLATHFAKLAPIHIFIAPGEHDPFTNQSLYALTQWPENVTIFAQERLDAVELAPGISIWGATCPLPHSQILRNFHVNRTGTHLLLLHRLTTDIEIDNSSTSPIPLDAIGPAGFAFALFGGKHCTWTWPQTEFHVIYPGSPEPFAFDEDGGGHHIALLTIDEQCCTCQLLPINQWRWGMANVDITDCNAEREVLAKITHTLEGQVGQLHERTVFRVSLTGKPAFAINLKSLTAQLDVRAHVRLENRTTMPYDLVQLAQEQTVRGLLVRRFQHHLAACANEQERRKIQQALFVALRALDGEQIDPYETG